MRSSSGSLSVALVPSEIRTVATTPREPLEYSRRSTPQEETHPIAFPGSEPNGIDLSLDGTKLYWVEIRHGRDRRRAASTVRSLVRFGNDMETTLPAARSSARQMKSSRVRCGYPVGDRVCYTGR